MAEFTAHPLQIDPNGASLTLYKNGSGKVVAADIPRISRSGTVTYTNLPDKFVSAIEGAAAKTAKGTIGKGEGLASVVNSIAGNRADITIPGRQFSPSHVAEDFKTATDKGAKNAYSYLHGALQKDGRSLNPASALAKKLAEEGGWMAKAGGYLKIGGKFAASLAKRAPIVGGVVTTAVTLAAAGAKAAEGDYKGAAAELAAGSAEAVGNIAGFGVGDAAREAVRAGLLAAGGPEVEKSGLRELGETAAKALRSATNPSTDSTSLPPARVASQNPAAQPPAQPAQNSPANQARAGARQAQLGMQAAPAAPAAVI